MLKVSFAMFAIAAWSCLALAAWAQNSQQPPESPPKIETLAETFADQLAAEDFTTAAANFDATMAAAMPADKLREVWAAVEAQAGEFKTRESTRVARQAAYDIALVTCAFEKAKLVVRVVYDDKRQVAGLFFVPASPPPTPPTRPDDASAPVELDTGSGVLKGSLRLPKGEGPFTVALILAGSGPTDRDGNQPGLVSDYLRMIADALAANGIASLRYDKRGVAGSAAAATREADLRFDHYVADAAAWIDWLRRDQRFARIVVLGHSEGSLIGMLAAKRGAADAFVSLAGAGRAAADVLSWQLAKNLASQESLVLDSQRIIDQLSSGATVDDVPPPLATLFRPSVQPYLISWFAHDPAKAIASLDIPILITQGTTDIQVTVDDDARPLAAAAPNAKLAIIEGMNHVLKLATNDAEQNAAYTDSAVPLAPAVVDEIVAFLRQSPTSRP